MAPKIYRHPRNAEAQGHRGDCAFVNTSSPSCECERASYEAIQRAMTLLGWKVDDRGYGKGSEGSSYYRSFGPHIVTVAHCMAGWQLKWEKGPTFTYLDDRGFGTIKHCLTYFWGMTAERMDESSQLYWEHGAMTGQLDKAGIEPRRLGVKPKPSAPAEPGVLKHEVTEAMDRKGREDVTKER